MGMGVPTSFAPPSGEGGGGAKPSTDIHLWIPPPLGLNVEDSRARMTYSSDSRFLPGGDTA